MKRPDRSVCERHIILLRGLERGHEDVELRRVTPRHTSSHLERGHEDVELRRVGQKAERDEVLGDEREVAVLEPERDADQAEPRLGRDLRATSACVSVTSAWRRHHRASVGGPCAPRATLASRASSSSSS